MSTQKSSLSNKKGQKTHLPKMISWYATLLHDICVIKLIVGVISKNYFLQEIQPAGTAYTLRAFYIKFI